MWELKRKAKYWTVVLEKTHESPLDCHIKPVNPKGNQSWIFIGRTDTEAETPILWPSDAKSWFLRKDPDVGKDWSHEEKGMTGWDGWMASTTQWAWVWQSFDQALREVWCATVHGVAKSQTRLSNWTELYFSKYCTVKWKMFTFCVCFYELFVWKVL